MNISMARQGSGADSDILLVHLQEEVGGIGNCGKRRLAASCRLKRTALFTSFDAICCIRTGSTSNSIYVEDTRTARFTLLDAQLDELTHRLDEASARVHSLQSALSLTHTVSVRSRR